MLKTLFGNIGEYLRASVLTPIFTLGEVVVEALLPIVMALIIDRGIEAGNMGAIVLFGGIMLVLAFGSLACGILGTKASSEASVGFAANLREAMYAQIQTYSFGNIDHFSTAGLVTRMTTDVTNVQNAYMMVLRIATRAPFTLITSIVACLMISARLSLVFVVAIVFLVAALSLLMSRSMGAFSRVFAQYDDLNESVQENVTAIRVVKAFAREEHETGKFNKAAETVYRLFVKAEGIMAFNNPIMMLAVYGSTLGIAWFGAQLVVGGSLTTGELTSMFSYIMSILMSLMMLSMIFVMVSMSAASARRICEVLDEEPEIVNPADPVMDVADGSIDFDHVSFSYKSGAGEAVLKDIDLSIKSGETIGIVGGTGSGKTSLISLVSRLYDVNAGAVRVGGVDVRSYDLETLRDAVSVVLQNNVLFSGSILDNLRWGNENASEEEFIEACRAACADEFIEQMPDGYNTWIERGGANVSGGQRQRLCIARALLKRPKVLIFDDSTSAVDTATDAKIRAALAAAIPGTTKLIISQRISSVSHADRIIVLDEGRVSGFDTHEALLETNAIYRDIYDMQSSGSGDFDEE